MKLKIIGSGGCVALPKPLCKCRICKEARLKGHPYSRYGCSLFIEDLGMLIDTPEDITQAINFSEIDEINYVLYSHVDPDHTLGMRVFEHIRLNWLEISKGKECTNPVNVLAMEHVMEDINSIKFKLGSYLDYYENIRKLIRRKVIESSIIIDGIKISFLKANHATVFVFEKDNKKVIYAPCDVKPFPNDIIFEGADLLIIGNTVVGDELKDGFILDGDNPLRKELFTLDEIQNLKNNYSIKNVIITHLEEDWGKSYDDYTKLEKQYKSIKFAYDGMEMEI